MSMIDAPLRRRLVLVFAATLLFCAGSYLWLDRPVALWFKANLHGTWSVLFHRITELGLGGVWLVPAALGAILFRWAEVRAKSDRAQALWHVHANAALFLFLSVAASGLTVDLLKGVIGRLRPYELFVHGAYGFAPLSIDWGRNSFPSGHGQTIVAAMTSLAAIWPRGRPLWYAVAVLVAASRVIISVHYLSDVAMGAYFGVVGTILLARLFRARGWQIDVSGTWRLRRD